MKYEFKWDEENEDWHLYHNDQWIPLGADGHRAPSTPVGEFLAFTCGELTMYGRTALPPLGQSSGAEISCKDCVIFRLEEESSFRQLGICSCLDCRYVAVDSLYSDILTVKEAINAGV